MINAKILIQKPAYLSWSVAAIVPGPNGIAGWAEISDSKCALGKLALIEPAPKKLEGKPSRSSDVLGHISHASDIVDLFLKREARQRGQRKAGEHIDAPLKHAKCTHERNPLFGFLPLGG